MNQCVKDNSENESWHVVIARHYGKGEKMPQ